MRACVVAVVVSFLARVGVAWIARLAFGSARVGASGRVTVRDMIDDSRERNDDFGRDRETARLHEAELDRLRALGAMVVHDLGNALFAITGRTQLLERRAADDATKASAREILGSVRMLEELLARLRNACRSATPASSETRLAPLRETIAVAADRLASAHPALASLAAGAPADARCDMPPNDLARALAQCLDAHARWGGAGWDAEDDARSRAGIAASIEITDGDDASASIRLESRARADAPASFTAPSLLAGEPALEDLGVLAAQRAIRESGGRVAWSVLGEGGARSLATTVILPITRGIPLVRESAAGASRASRSADDAATHESTPIHDDAHDHDCDACLADAAPRRVLIADDDPAVRAILVAVLESIGDDVDTIDDPAAILGRTDLDEFDVAILDAGGGGLGALDRLRALGNGLPVLLASGDLVERVGDPLTRTALKPLDLKRLDHALSALAALRQRG